MIPNKGKNEQEELITDELELIESIKSSNDDLTKLIDKSINEVNKKMADCQAAFLANINKNDIWKRNANFVFSATAKHPEVKVITEHIVKSSNSSGYKYSIMEPHAESLPNLKSFSFKVKESNSNWLAVGLCHKKIVQGKNYTFSFSSLGHGGYLISSNGGSWSTTKS